MAYIVMKNLSKLTVGEYQALYYIHTSKDEEIDKAVASVSILTGKTRWEVEEMDFKEFTHLTKELNILFGAFVSGKPKTSLKINGKKYQVCLNPRKLSAGQYIDLQHFLKGNMIDNLHKIMACLVVPKKRFGVGKYDGENHELISVGIQDLNFIDVHSTCVFFSLLWSNSIKAITPYLSQEVMKKNPSLSPQDLQSIMDGFLTHPRLQSMSE